MDAAQASSAPVLPASMSRHSSSADVVAGLERHVVGPGRRSWRWSRGEQRGRGAGAPGASASSRTSSASASSASPARIARRAEQRPHGRPVPALRSPSMRSSCSSEKLCTSSTRDRAGHADRGRRARRPRPTAARARAGRPCRRRSTPGCRPRRPSRGGSSAGRVQLGCEASRRRRAAPARPRRAPGRARRATVGSCDHAPSRIAHRAEPSGAAERRERAAAAACRCAPRPPSWRASRCRSTPRRGTGRDGVRWPGASAPLPGAARNVARALPGDEEVERPRRRAAAGKQLGQRGRIARDELGGRPADLAVGGRQRHRQVLARRRSPDDAVRSKTHCTGVPTPAANGGSVTRPVVHDVHVDDRRCARAAAQPIRGRRRAGREQRGGGVGGARRATTASAPIVPPSSVARRDAPSARRAMPLDAVRRCGPRRPARGQGAPRPASPCSVAERHAATSRCRPRRRRSSRPVWNTIAASAERRLVARRGSAWQGDQVPQRRRSPRATGRARRATRRRSRASSAGSSGSSRRSASAARTAAQPLAAGEVAVAERAPGRGGAAPAGGRGAAAPCAPPGASDRHRRGVLEHARVGRAEPVEERAVGGAAAQEHVLAVVDAEPVALERVGGAAEPRARLEQRDLGAGVGAASSAAVMPGQPAADDHDPVRLSRPARDGGAEPGEAARRDPAPSPSAAATAAARARRPGRPSMRSSSRR